MKKDSGFTLTEVLVSVVIAGIIGICIINVFIYKIKIDKKTTLKVEISNRIVEFFNEFTALPSEFDDIYSSNYDESKNAYIVYFPNSKTSYYVLSYQDYQINDGFYQLDIKVFVNNEQYILNNNESLSRRIYYGGK